MTVLSPTPRFPRLKLNRTLAAAGLCVLAVLAGCRDQAISYPLPTDPIDADAVAPLVAAAERLGPSVCEEFREFNYGPGFYADDLGGSCWACPPGYVRTDRAVTVDGACAPDAQTSEIGSPADIEPVRARFYGKYFAEGCPASTPEQPTIVVGNICYGCPADFEPLTDAYDTPYCRQ